MTQSNAAARISRLSPLWRWLIIGAVVVVLWILFPPVRIVPLDSNGKVRMVGSSAAIAFDAATFADAFWNEKLVPSFESATSLSSVLDLLSRDPAEAMKQYGRKVGVGTTIYYFATGEGKVVEVKGSRVVVEIDGFRVALRVGPIFGNAVRDGCGLLNVNDVPGLEEFNGLSAVLNQKVEERVLPRAREIAQVGSRIAFVGCAPAPEAYDRESALVFIPLQVEEVR